MHQTQLSLFLLLLFFGVVVVQMFYLLYFFLSAFKKRKLEHEDFLDPISVIIIGRNEKENLKEFLPSILNQDYPNFEVIVVNDLSWDGTRSYIEKLQESHEHLRLVNVPSTDNKLSVGKKFGLTLGVKAATNNHLLFIDADCQPYSDQWIRLMAQGYTGGKQIVLGVGDYRLRKGFVAWLQQFEALQIALQYIGFANSGMPYMGVGRNLGYTRKLFMDGKGFAGHLHITSGDDDLFVNDKATAANTSAVAQLEGMTNSIPKKSIAEWIRQKQRHFSTVSHYKRSHQVVLGIHSFAMTLFWVLWMALLVLGEYATLVWVLFGIRLLSYMLIAAVWAHRFQSLKTILFYPIGEFFVWLVQLISFSTKSGKSIENW